MKRKNLIKRICSVGLAAVLTFSMATGALATETEPASEGETETTATEEAEEYSAETLNANTGTKTVYILYYIGGEEYGEVSTTVSADTWQLDTSSLPGIPEGYAAADSVAEITGDSLAGYYAYVVLQEKEPEVPTSQTVGVNYWDVENGVQAGEGEVTVAVGANNVNTSALTDVPAGFELVTTGDIPINGGWIWVEVRPAAQPTSQTVGVNYWDVENNVQAGEGEVTVASDANNVNTSALTDIPDGYELVSTGDIAIYDKWIWVEVRPVTTKEIGVNYWNIESNEQVTEGKVTVDINANNVNTSQLTDIPAGYELVNVGDIQINDGWIWVELRPLSKTIEIGVNYWDIEKNEQVTEGKVTVAADAYNVNTSQLTDIPAGYELVNVGDIQINDGWIWVELRPVAKTKSIGVNYFSFEEYKTIAESTVEVEKDAIHVNTSLLKDVPEGYELVVTGDLLICDGWIFAEVRKIDTKTVAVEYYIEAEDRTISGKAVEVEYDANNVNTSLLTDIPAGYELVWTGDLQIEEAEDGTLFVKAELRAKKMDVYFVIEDTNMGSFTLNARSAMVSFTDLEAVSGKTYEIPGVQAAEGYKFTGWKDSTGSILWDAAQTTFELTPGMGIYPEGAAKGMLILTAQFETVPAQTESESETNQSESTAPETDQSETAAPETNQSESTAPETNQSESTALETDPASEPSVPAVTDPETDPELDEEEPSEDEDGSDAEDEEADVSDSEKKDTSSTEATEASSDSNAVNTGDETPIFLYAVLMAAAAAVLAVALKMKRIHMN
ncbi:MAG TPA: sortase B protein-sorting domain-containing protein [Candidatus Choladousia intestinavium]|uniref:Sortase B protein-sorting domain-containing protein n=1 Tax=Candidatus Choladousia intestinavium TaxID=2840727 RepID=A0A9D1ADT4_9FIRM|nr:sortase B protein-sorting domain-containing protein [Candidatus Choladousia intestinavium]